MPNSAGWYYRKSGWMEDSTEGPLTDENMISLAFGGTLPRQTLVTHPRYTQGQWVHLESIPNFRKQLDLGEQTRETTRRLQEQARRDELERQAQVQREEAERRRVEQQRMREEEERLIAEANRPKPYHHNELVTVWPNGYIECRHSCRETAKLVVKSLRLVKRQVSLEIRQLNQSMREIRQAYSHQVRGRMPKFRGRGTIAGMIRSFQDASNHDQRAQMGYQLAPLENTKSILEVIGANVDQVVISIQSDIAHGVFDDH